MIRRTVANGYYATDRTRYTSVVEGTIRMLMNRFGFLKGRKFGWMDLFVILFVFAILYLSLIHI